MESKAQLCSFTSHCLIMMSPKWLTEHAKPGAQKGSVWLNVLFFLSYIWTWRSVLLLFTWWHEAFSHSWLNWPFAQGHWERLSWTFIRVIRQRKWRLPLRSECSMEGEIWVDVCEWVKLWEKAHLHFLHQMPHGMKRNFSGRRRGVPEESRGLREG